MQGWINSSQMAPGKMEYDTHIHIREAIANMQKSSTGTSFVDRIYIMWSGGDSSVQSLIQPSKVGWPHAPLHVGHIILLDLVYQSLQTLLKKSNDTHKTV